MTLKQQLTEDMKTAMRAKDQVTLDSIRFIMSKVKNFEIDKPNHEEATEAEVQTIIRKVVKDSQEGMSMYATGGRQDLVAAEEEKVAVYQRYLPQQLSDDEVWSLIEQARAANPDLAQGPLTGKVLGAAQGRTDGGVVARLLRERA
jgi:uncharacterized protein YqeY